MKFRLAKLLPFETDDEQAAIAARDFIQERCGSEAATFVLIEQDIVDTLATFTVTTHVEMDAG